MSRKVGILRAGRTTFPTCNTKAYQRALAVRLRRFADMLDDPNTLVGKKRDFAGDDTNVTWWFFGTSGMNGKHFEAFGAIDRPSKDDDFTPTAPAGGGGDPPPIDG